MIGPEKFRQANPFVAHMDPNRFLVLVDPIILARGKGREGGLGGGRVRSFIVLHHGSAHGFRFALGPLGVGSVPQSFCRKKWMDPLVLPHAIYNLKRIHQVYIVIIYTYTAYSCVNNYYSTARKAVKIGQMAYVMGSSVKNRLAQWWVAKPPTETKQNSIQPDIATKQVELTDVKPATEHSVLYNLPSSLDDVVIDYFTAQ
jgi:hypothetical protein